MDEITSFYRAEVERLRAERDAAVASERRLWAAVGELREAVGRLESLAVAAQKEADGNDRVLCVETYESVIGDSIDSTQRVRKWVEPVAG